jgi:LCP family protein required for cell wall assembly
LCAISAREDDLTSQAHDGGGCKRSLMLQFLLFVFFLLFGCGALFFAYQVFDTVRAAVITLGVPDIGDLSAFAMPQPAATRQSTPNVTSERVNVLLMGIDRRPTEKCPCRTDTMIIASLDPKTLSASVVTIPRDLFVSIPGVGENRINTANFYGEANKYPGGGPGLAKQTVEYNLGRRIHYYVLVDFGGFRKAIDALGGIDITVAKPIDDPCYPTDDFKCMTLHIPAGKIHMNGELALQYARTRHQGGDFERMKRDIQVLMAVRDKALRIDILPKLPQLLQTMRGTVETDLTPQEILALGQIAAKVKTENIKSTTIDDTVTVETRTNTGAWVLWPIRDKIGQLMDRYIPPDNGMATMARVQQEGAKILVLNGTKNTQLAESTAKFLQAQGFQISAYGNADRFDYAKSVLIDYKGTKTATVTSLVWTFHIDPQNLRSNRNVKSDEDLRLILGSDWSLPSEKQ